MVERVLEEHAVELGARVVRGRSVAGFAEDAGGVVVEFDDGSRVRAGFLVGCDGARSAVRRLAGVGFAGEASRSETLMGEMEVGVSAEEVAAGVAGAGPVAGSFWLRPFGGVYSVVVPAEGVAPRGSAPTLDDFRRGCVRLRGRISGCIRRGGCRGSGTRRGWRTRTGWGGCCWPVMRRMCIRRWAGRG
nr:hypothetical protein GCM10025732_37860 [Glycomyces mayteni]